MKRLLLSAAFLLSACEGDPSAAVRVSVIDRNEAVANPFARSPGPAGRIARAAVAQGLVAFDDQGQIVPALAERWIVTDDGQSYIFRLREAEWDGGGEVTAVQVAQSLRMRIAEQRDARLGSDLSLVREIRSMTGSVIEIRLIAPKPDLLQVLAQPELGISSKGRGTGAMQMAREGKVATFTMRPTDLMLADPEMESPFRPVILRSETAARALARYALGESDMIQGGRFQHLPLLNEADINRTAIQLDPVIGLFGLVFVEQPGIFAAPAVREALSMAIDRDALLAPFNVSGWQPTTHLVGSGVPGISDNRAERWENSDMAARRVQARSRIAAAGNPPTLRIALPQGAGADLFYYRLRKDFKAVGVDSVRVPMEASADLRLVDEVAVFGAVSWYLIQLGCGRQPQCDEEADFVLNDAMRAIDSDIRSDKLDEASRLMTASNLYIPIASPIRWTLVRSGYPGFAPNSSGWHPLPPLAIIPN